MKKNVSVSNTVFISKGDYEKKKTFDEEGLLKLLTMFMLNNNFDYNTYLFQNQYKSLNMLD